MENYKRKLGITSPKSAIATLGDKQIVLEDYDLNDRLQFDEPITFGGVTYKNQDVYSSYVAAWAPVVECDPMKDYVELDQINLGLAQYEVYTNPNGRKTLLIYTADRLQDVLVTRELVKFIESQYADDRIEKVELFIPGLQNDHKTFADLGYNENLEKPHATAHKFDQDYESLFMKLMDQITESDLSSQISGEITAFRTGNPELAPHITIDAEDNSEFLEKN